MITDGTFRLVSVGLSIASVALIGHLALTYRRPRPLSPIVSVAYLLLVPTMVGAYCWLVGAWVPPAPAGVSVVLGLSLGWLQARAARVYLERDRVMIQNAPWYLVAWGAAYLFSQAAHLVSAELVPIGAAVVALVLTSSIVWGLNATLLFRALRPVTGPRSAAAASR